MTVRRIAVIYDTSYLTEPFQSIRKFILSRRFSSQEKQGLMGSLRSMMAGKSGKPWAESTVHHEPGSLFYVYEVIPTEVLKQLAQGVAAEAGEPKAVASLLEDGAVRVDLSMDTVVGEHGLGGHHQRAPGNEPTTRRTTITWATRLLVTRLAWVTYGTNERYDLSIVATEDEDLLAQLDAMAKAGKAVFGVGREHLSGTRLVHDKLTELANLGRATPLQMANSTGGWRLAEFADGGSGPPAL